MDWRSFFLGGTSAYAVLFIWLAVAATITKYIGRH